MDSVNVGPLNVDYVRDAKARVSDMDRFAAGLFAGIWKELQDDFVAESLGLSMEIAGDKRSAKLESPFGPGRIVYSPRFNEMGIHGRFVVQRRETNEKDEQVWVEAWTFFVSDGGLVMDEKLLTIMELRKVYRQEYFTLTLNILAALGK